MKQKITTLFALIATLCMMACNSTTVFDEYKDVITERVKLFTVDLQMINQDESQMDAFAEDLYRQFGDGCKLDPNTIKMYNGPYKSTALEFLKRYDELEISFTKPKLRTLDENELKLVGETSPRGKYWCFKEQNTGIHYYAYIDPNNRESFMLAYNGEDADNYQYNL